MGTDALDAMLYAFSSGEAYARTGSNGQDFQ